MWWLLKSAVVSKDRNKIDCRTCPMSGTERWALNEQPQPTAFQRCFPYSVEPKVRLQGYGYNPFCSHSSRCLAVLA